MAFKIINLNVHTSPKSGDIYFFDANVWLWLLGIKQKLEPHESRYIAFFQAVAKLDCVIILPALLVSEVANRKLKFEMYNYARKKGDKLDETYFKQKYRYTQECKTALQTIYDDIGIYARSCTLVNDKFGEQDFKQVDLFITTGPLLEFNDHYLFKLAKDSGAKIVTHDKDFKVEDVEICTYNNQIIK